MKKLIIAATAVILSTSAMAWGDREQGALAGILGTILWQKIDQNGKPQGEPVVIEKEVIVERPVYRVNRVKQCEELPIYDYDNQHKIIGYRRTCQ